MITPPVKTIAKYLPAFKKKYPEIIRVTFNKVISWTWCLMKSCKLGQGF